MDIEIVPIQQTPYWELMEAGATHVMYATDDVCGVLYHVVDAFDCTRISLEEMYRRAEEAFNDARDDLCRD